MMFKTHLVFSLLISLLIIKFFPVNHKILFILLVILTSSLPDLDSHKSKIGRKIPFISNILELLFGHRGFLHSIFPPVILFLIFFYFKLNFISFSILIGYLSHLFSDMLTLEGIKPFYPLSEKRLSGFFKTGSLTEFFVFIILFVLDLFIIFKNLLKIII